MNLNAAGIAVGSAEHYVAVPIRRDPHPVQKFGSFTAELYRMVKWLLDLGREVGGDASQRRLLDRALPDSGRTRSRGQGDQRALYPEVARGQE